MRLLICSLILSILLSSSSAFASKKLQPVAMYKVITDSVNKDVPEGKCLITGVVMHHGVKIENANIYSQSSIKAQANKQGRFRVIVDTADTYLIIQKANLPETYVEYYKFKNQHHIEIEVYIPDENVMIMVDKPVIYFYGNEDQNVSFNIEPTGDFTFTYPLINNQNNWTGTLSSAGIMIDKKVYPYIFYETKMKELSFIKNENTIAGSVISPNEVVSFLEQSLTSLNLNSQEQTDFITYWAPRMIQHGKVFVQLWTANDYNAIATIKITPTPDHMQRVFMVYAPMDNDIELETTPQKFTPIERTGFTVIEWGGSELPLQKLYTLKTL